MQERRQVVVFVRHAVARWACVILVKRSPPSWTVNSVVGDSRELLGTWTMMWTIGVTPWLLVGSVCFSTLTILRSFLFLLQSQFARPADWTTAESIRPCTLGPITRRSRQNSRCWGWWAHSHMVACNSIGRVHSINYHFATHAVHTNGYTRLSTRQRLWFQRALCLLGRCSRSLWVSFSRSASSKISFIGENDVFKTFVKCVHFVDRSLKMLPYTHCLSHAHTFRILLVPSHTTPETLARSPFRSPYDRGGWTMETGPTRDVGWYFAANRPLSGLARITTRRQRSCGLTRSLDRAFVSHQISRTVT